MKLISSDWFSYFLQYLELKYIANLDSAFCNHEDRIHWLILLKQYCAPYVYIVEEKSGNILINWLLLKKVGVKLLKFWWFHSDLSKKIIWICYQMKQ